MSIFKSIGRLTYKTQKVVTRTVADPIKDFTTGYKEVKAHEAKMEDITKTLLEKEEGLEITPKTFAPKTPVQGEFDFKNV